MEQVGNVLLDSMKRTTQPAPSNRLCTIHGLEFPEETLTVAGRPIVLPGRCPTCHEEAITLEAAARKQEAENRRLQARMAMGVPERYVHAAIVNFREENEDQKRVGGVVRNFVRGGWERSSGLLFLGNVGTAKTMLGAALVNHWLEHHGPHSARYYTMAELMRRVKQTWNPESFESEVMAYDRLTKLALLVVDEIGCQYGTQAETMIFTEVINRRYNALRPTILIGNLTVDECVKVLGDRVMDRFRDGGHALAFTWPSQRGAQFTA